MFVFKDHDVAELVSKDIISSQMLMKLWEMTYRADILLKMTNLPSFPLPFFLARLPYLRACLHTHSHFSLRRCDQQSSSQEGSSTMSKDQAVREHGAAQACRARTVQREPQLAPPRRAYAQTASSFR
jgi:hypothetical protein